MWGSPLAKKWGSTQTVKLNDGTGQGNNIAVFPTYVQGICAQLDLWRTSKHYRNKPFKDAIRVWSGGNHVESYIAFVLKRVPGMTRDTIMDDAFWRSSMGIAFLKAQAWHEAGKPYPAPAADWIEAQNIVFGKSPEKTWVPTDVKPVVKSKSIAAEVVSLLSLLLAYVTDIRFLLVVVAVVSVFVIYDRYRKGDLQGWFKAPEPAPVKKRTRKK
jgi:hypothetical protein